MELKKIVVFLFIFSFLSCSDYSLAKEPPARQPISDFDEYNSGVNKPAFDVNTYSKVYKGVTKDGRIMEALEMMKGTIADFSYKAIMGNNLTNRKVKIQFRNLAEIREEYASFDALGWKKGKDLYIYVNEKHELAPPEALAAVLAHEAIHQDEFSSLNEETYAWMLEAAVWSQLVEKNPKVQDVPSSLVKRENGLKKLFEKGDYTDKYIKKAVYTNPGYTNLPKRSPGFEDEDL